MAETPRIHTLIKEAIKDRNWGGRIDSITHDVYRTHGITNIYIYYEEFEIYQKHKTKFILNKIFNFMLEIIEAKIDPDELKNTRINFKALNGTIECFKQY